MFGEGSTQELCTVVLVLDGVEARREEDFTGEWTFSGLSPGLYTLLAYDPQPDTVASGDDPEPAVETVVEVTGETVGPSPPSSSTSGRSNPSTLTTLSTSPSLPLPPTLPPSLPLSLPTENDRNCIAYTMGTQCYEYIWKVYSDNTTLFSEASISSMVEISHQFTRRCCLFIKSVLCHLLFPYCDPFTIDVGGYSPLPMCPVTCANLEQECGKDIDKFGGEFSGFLRERCERDVDRWGESGPGDKPGCIYVDPDHPLKGQSLFF